LADNPRGCGSLEAGVLAATDRSQAEEEENQMTHCILKCTADGKHEVWTEEGKVGGIHEEELRQHVKNHLGMKDGEAEGTGTAASQLHSLVRATAKSRSVNERQALDVVLATAHGKELWEQKRLDELAETRVEKRWEQKRLDEINSSLILGELRQDKS
jgi:hypothetical protein